jgi:hypothetical protein
MRRHECHRDSSGTSGINWKTGDRRYTPGGEWTGFTVPVHTRRFWAGVIALCAIGLLARPASAQQTSSSDRWLIQGGLHGGASMFSGRGTLPEFGIRLAAKRKTQVLDLTVSAFQQRYIRYDLRRTVSRWFPEVMAGMAWQPNALSIGFRSGLVIGRDGQGGYHTLAAFGPHVGLNVPVASRFGLRGEAGAHLFASRTHGLGGPRGYLRVGIEARTR